MDVTRWLLHPGEMLKWFQAKMRDFFTLPSRIAALRASALKVAEIAMQRGRPDVAQQSQQIAGNLGVTTTNHASVQQRISGFLSRLGAMGIQLPASGGTLGIVPAIPIALIVVGGGIALAVAAIFSDYAKQERALKEVAAGVLTPEEAAKIIAAGKTFSFDVGSALKPLAWVAGFGALIFFWPQLRRAFAR